MATCAKCSKIETAELSLKMCAKCKSVNYCDRACQTSDWKKHKKDCSRLAGERASKTGAPTGGQGSTPRAGITSKADGPHMKPFHAVNENRFLHDRSEQQTFELLVDCLRLRQEDEYKFEHNNLEGSIFDGVSPSSERAFRAFISKAKETKGFLPPWLTDAKIEECIQWALKKDHDFSLFHAQEKPNIQEAWGDDLMPMKLRMMADKVYGNTPGGFNSKPMMDMQLRMERGGAGGFTSMLHMNL